MIDPFTISTGVAGFVSLTLEIGKILHEYSSNVKNAPNEVSDLISEVHALGVVFEQLKVLLRSSELMARIPLFSPQSVLHKVLVSCGEELKDLYQRLENRALVQGKGEDVLARSLDRLKWPIGKKRLQDAAQRLHRLSQALTFSLTISSCEIMSQSCDEITETIKAKNAQLDSLHSMMPHISDELRQLSDQMKSVIDLIPVMNSLSGDVQNIAFGVKSLELDQKNEKRNRFLRWLSSLDPPRRHLDVGANRMEKTGQWFLEDQAVKTWETGPSSSILLCFGIPGAGKTVLMSLLIDHLKASPKSQKFGVAYVYCDYRDQTHQTPINILGALLKQLLQSLEEIPGYAIDICGDAFRASEVLDLSMAEHVLQLTCRKFHKTYLCLDALDECSEKTINPLLASLKRLRAALSTAHDLDESTDSITDQSTSSSNRDCSRSSLKLVMTSRPHMESLLGQKFEHSLTVVIEAKESDICTFVGAKIDDDSDPCLMEDRLRHEIVEKIVVSSQKMFLLPAIQISAVLEGRTLFERRENLRNFSSDLDSAFGETLLRIRKQPDNSSKTALKIIAWTHLTTRPLHVSEMFHALATNRGDTSVNWDNFQSPTTWLKCCLGLVIVDKETSTVRLVHNSFDEYLGRQGATIISFEHVHLQIVETCLTYLDLEDVSSYSSKQFAIGNQRDEARSEHRDGSFNSPWSLEDDPEDPFEDSSGLFDTKLFGYYGFSKSSISKIRHKFPFVPYAVAYWGYHARNVERIPELLLKSASHYISQPQSELKWSLPFLMLSFSTPPTWWDIPRRCEILTGLHVASYFGLGPVVEEYCRSFCDPLSLMFSPMTLNAPDFDGRTALSWAAESGSDNAVQALLSYRAINIDEPDRDSRTPLSWASANGHASVVNLLLRHGAKTHIGDEKVSGRQRTPLHLACNFGYTEVVKILLQHRAQADFPNILTFGRLLCSDPRPPLMLAASGGHDGVVKLLIAEGVEIDPRDLFGRTPLWAAIENNHCSTARLLLENGADIHAQTNDGKTLLMLALSTINLEMVKFLLESGADVNQRANRTGTTALMLAASHRGVSATKFLLDQGARVEIRDARGFTALTCASEVGEVSVAKLLVSRGACLNSTTYALGAAGRKYSNLNMDEEPVTAVGHAIKNGKEAMAKFLLSAGAEVDSCDSRRQTDLFYAVRGCEVSNVKLLLQHGATADFNDSEGRTPLSWAIDPLNFASHQKPPSLEEHAFSRYDKRLKKLEQQREEMLPTIALLLLDAGAAIDHRDLNGRSALSYAAQRRYDQVIQVLCDHGANVNLEDQNGRSPFSWAAEGYWSLPIRAYMSNSSGATTLKLLLDKGADITSCDNYGRFPLWWAATSPNNQEVIKFLLDHNAVANLSMPEAQLCKGGRPSYHDLFMYYQDRIGLVPLIHGLRGNSNDLAKFSRQDLNLFLNHGLNIDAMLESGRTLLSWAEGLNRSKLLAWGADPNIADLEGRTPLFWAAIEGKAWVVSELLDYGAEVDFQDNTGRTPLSWLASQAQASLEVARALLKQGANRDCTDDDGRSPLWYAETSKNEELLRVLKTAHRGGTSLPAASAAEFDIVD